MLAHSLSAMLPTACMVYCQTRSKTKHKPRREVFFLVSLGFVDIMHYKNSSPNKSILPLSVKFREYEELQLIVYLLKIGFTRT